MRKKSGLNRSYDYVVVGAGSAGCVVANRLSADPARNVLLLEAGKSDRSLIVDVPLGVNWVVGGALDWQFQSEPEPAIYDRRLKLPRGKVLGGSSSINGMIYVRGHADDYNEWESLGAAGWSYESVQTYFRRSETWGGPPAEDRGTSGPLPVVMGRYRTPLLEAFIAAGKQLGHRFLEDYNRGDHEGFAWVQYSQEAKRAIRCSSARAYLRPIQQRRNLTVQTNARVVGLVLNGRRCTGVRYLVDGREEVVNTHEVILSAGAYMSPYILMSSGIGPADELRAAGVVVRHDLSGVGRNLQDHCGSLIQSACTKPLTYHSLTSNPLRGAKAILEYLFTNSGPISVFPMSVHAFLRSSPQESRPDLQFQFYPVSRDLRGGSGKIGTFNAYTIQWGGMRPRSRGTVTLKSSDPLAGPRIQHNFLSDPHDAKVMIEGLKIARDINSQSAFENFRGNEIDPGAHVQTDSEIDAYNRRTVGSEYHASGSCKMGVDDAAVVDPWLRVHGIEGLRVIDASIMPTIVSGNTNGPSIMIGEKGAELILEPAPRASLFSVKRSAPSGASSSLLGQVLS